MCYLIYMHYFLDLTNTRMSRPRGQVMSKVLYRLWISLGEYLYPAIVEVSYISPNLVLCRGPLHKVPKPDPLDPAADQKPSRYHLSPMRSNTP